MTPTVHGHACKSPSPTCNTLVLSFSFSIFAREVSLENEENDFI